MENKEQSANKQGLENGSNQNKIQEKPKTPIEKLKNWEEISEVEEKEILKTQFSKINKASKNSHHNIDEIANPKLKSELDKSLSLWETNEVKQKISTGEEVKSMVFYLPQDLQDHKLDKFLQGEERQCLIDSKSENALLEMTKKTPKQETWKVGEIPQKEEIIQQIEQKKEEIMQEVQAENKWIWEQVWDFFKALLEMILNFLKGFDSFFKPKKQEEKKEVVKKQEWIPRVEGKLEGWKIQAIIGGKEIVFESENIPMIAGRQEKQLEWIEETIVLVGNEKYIIKDWKVFDWNGTMDWLSQSVKYNVWDVEYDRVQKELTALWEKTIDNFTYNNFIRNEKLLSWLIFLWHAKINPIQEKKRDTLRDLNSIFQIFELPTETIADNITVEAMGKIIDKYKAMYYPILRKYFTF